MLIEVISVLVLVVVLVIQSQRLMSILHSINKSLPGSFTTTTDKPEFTELDATDNGRHFVVKGGVLEEFDAEVYVCNEDDKELQEQEEEDLLLATAMNPVVRV